MQRSVAFCAPLCSASLISPVSHFENASSKVFLWIVLLMAKTKLSLEEEDDFDGVSKVRRKIFEGSNNYLVTFHKGLCYNCVYEALDLISFSRWMNSKHQICFE